jgi:hypothetical protein
MAVRIIKQNAPELTEDQISELTSAWIPGAGGEAGKEGSNLPPAVLLSMIEQFVSYSQGTMAKPEEKGLRAELGAWPERYWKAFPEVIRLILSDYLKNIINEKEFQSQIRTALSL